MKRSYHKYNKPNGYPLPDRTVLFSRKKHLEPIPGVGKKYHCFDDGKITFSRCYVVKVTEVLGHNAFKKKYPNLFKEYIKESKGHYWLYSRSSDKFIIADTLTETENEPQVFVRTKQGYWFALPHTLWCGILDVTGKIWNNLIKNIDNFNYTEEEKRELVKEFEIE